MTVINITNARKDFYRLVENVNCFNEPALIPSKNGNAVLLSEDDWNAIQETLYPNFIPGMADSLTEGKGTSLNDCLAEDSIAW